MRFTGAQDGPGRGGTSSQEKPSAAPPTNLEASPAESGESNVWRAGVRSQRCLSLLCGPTRRVCFSLPTLSSFWRDLLGSSPRAGLGKFFLLGSFSGHQVVGFANEVPQV